MHTNNTRIYGRSFKFSKTDLETLFEYILIDDEPCYDAGLPQNPSPILSSEMIRKDWGIAYVLLNEYYSPKKFRKLVWSIVWKEPNADQQRYFKDIRARFKNLRHAFTTFDKQHNYPFMIHVLTFFMGELQDAYKTHYTLNRILWGLLLWATLNPICSAVFNYQISSISTVTPDELLEFHKAENQKLRDALKLTEMTGSSFHSLRKIISRRVACFDCLRTVYPSSDLNTLSERLATINGLMGEFHDTLVEKRLAKTQDYHKFLFPWPDDIRKYMQAYLDHVDKTHPQEILI